MILAITTVILVIIGVFTYIIKELLDTTKELAKLVKSDNLQEYEDIEDRAEEQENIDVWQERFKEVWSMTENELKDIKVNPDQLYKWAFWWWIKVEKFNQ